LEGFFGITDNVKVVTEGDTLSLGRRTLRFHSTPFLHWPETIMTYEMSHRILFSCDAFGSYGALQGAIFDDDCNRLDFYTLEALRYYVNIVANFSARVLSAIEKLNALPVDIIAPSHGLIWRENIALIIDLYRRWAEYATGPTEPGVTLLFGSMYGNTEIVMDAVAEGVSLAKVPVNIFDVARTHVSYILPSLWTQRGVMIGAPTYEVSLFPPMADVLVMAGRKRIHNKTAAYFGSYGWSGGAQREVRKIIDPFKWELTDSLEFKGSPRSEDIENARQFGMRFAERVKRGK